MAVKKSKNSRVKVRGEKRSKDKKDRASKMVTGTLTKSTYRAKDITVLEGLEPVRQRPAMYIGGVDSRGLHHLLWEIIDNSIDEVINGYASTIEVELDAD